MTWSYRVIEFLDPQTEEPWQAIHEVHYDAQGRPELYSEPPAVVMSHEPSGDVRGLGWVLDRMREALGKPILVERDFRRERAVNTVTPQEGEGYEVLTVSAGSPLPPDWAR